MMYNVCTYICTCVILRVDIQPKTAHEQDESRLIKLFGWNIMERPQI